MKFSEKYELFESLTTGAVETFVANDKVRGERVLVHIVECAPPKADQSTAEWVLDSFRRCAPEPPGPVLETGKYSGAKYGYVVTRPADDALVKAWVRRYEVQADETRETRVHALNAEVAIPPAAVPTPAKEPAQPAGTMTQLFRDFDSLAKSKTPAPVAGGDAAPRRSAPSTNLPGESGLHTAVSWDPANVKPAGPPKETPPAFPSAAPRPIVPEPSAHDLRSGAKAGEFTSFFQGPFRGDRPADTPAFSSEPIEPPKKSVGEFTAIFGQAGTAAPSTATPPKGSAGPSFTGIFKDMESAKAPLDAGSPVQNAVVQSPVQPLAAAPVNIPPTPDPVFVAPALALAPVPMAPIIPPLPSTPAGRTVIPQPSSQPGDGATGAFTRPSAEAAPPPVEIPSGPSPYTQIISRSKLPNAEAGEAAHGPGGTPPGKAAAPSMPKIPAAAPPIPKMPPPPSMPKVSAPKLPKAPKVDVPAPPPVSVLPLVITLGVLFVLAVILVLFFVMRH